MKNNKRFYRRNTKPLNIKCSCGGNAKLCINKNYPFGKKSSVVKSEFYRCNSCAKMIFTSKDTGGKNGSR